MSSAKEAGSSSSTIDLIPSIVALLDCEIFILGDSSTVSNKAIFGLRVAVDVLRKVADANCKAKNVLTPVQDSENSTETKMFIQHAKQTIAEAKDDIWMQWLTEEHDAEKSDSEGMGDDILVTEEVVEVFEDAAANFAGDGLLDFLAVGEHYRHPQVLATPVEHVITPFTGAMIPSQLSPFFEDMEPREGLVHDGLDVGHPDDLHFPYDDFAYEHHDDFLEFTPVYIPSADERVPHDELWLLPDGLDTSAADFWMPHADKGVPDEDLWPFSDMSESEYMSESELLEPCNVSHIFVHGADTGLLADYSFEKMYPGLSRPVLHQNHPQDAAEDTIETAIISSGSLVKPQLIHIHESPRNKRPSSPSQDTRQQQLQGSTDSFLDTKLCSSPPLTCEEYILWLKWSA